MMKQAALVVIRLLRVTREHVVHDELEHAHWDRDERRWITHSSST